MDTVRAINANAWRLEIGQRLERLYAFLPLPGRVFLAALFIWSGLGKITGWQMAAGYMTAHNMPLVPLFLAAAIVFELAGGIMLLIGFYGRLAAGALFLYLIPTTLIFHNFWAVTDQMQHMMQLINFMKNLSIMGGMLMVVGLGSGGYSLDHRLGKGVRH